MDSTVNNESTCELFGAATQLSQSQSWLDARFGAPRLASLGIHVALAGLAIIPWASGLPARPKLNQTAVLLYTPADIVRHHLQFPARPHGGGGGGKHQPLPASRGVLPR